MLLRLLLLVLSTVISAAPAEAQTSAAQASVRLLNQTNIVNTADLEFGTVAVGPGGGAVVLSPTSAGSDPRTVSGNVTLLPGVAHAAVYDVRGRGNLWVSVGVPTTAVTLTQVGGTANLTLLDFTVAPVLKGKTARLKLDKLGRAVMRVGGKLTLPDNAPEGQYRGTFEVTLDGF